MASKYSVGRSASGYRPYTRGSATGRSSRFGGAVGGSARRVLNPWGNLVPAAKGRRANAVGATIARGRPRGSGVRRPTPDASLWGMRYPVNDPNAWPIEGTKSGPTSGMTQAKADFNNAVVNKAFQRAGYAG